MPDYKQSVPTLLKCKDSEDYISLLETVEKLVKLNPNFPIDICVLAGPPDKFYIDEETGEQYNSTRWVQVSANPGQQALIMETNKALMDRKRRLERLATNGESNQSESDTLTSENLSPEERVQEILKKILPPSIPPDPFFN